MALRRGWLVDEGEALTTNLANWESRVPVHVAAHGLDRFVEDPAHLSAVVRHDALALGELTGLKVAHLTRWAQVVAGLLTPGGRLYLRDGHPTLMTLDETRTDQQLVMTHPYFGGVEPVRWEDDSSYTGEAGAITSPVTYEWHHPLSEIVQAVLDAGLVLTRLAEDDGLDWAFASWMERDADGRYRFPGEQRRAVPTEFTLEATRPR